MFENLKNVLGEAYHDDITAEEVNSFFAGKNFADLSTGQFIDKNKYDREIQTLNATITEKENALTAKLTDSEKADKERDDAQKEIQRLTELLKQNTLSGNKNLALGTTADLKSVLNLQDNDSEYQKFIDNIVSDNADKTNSIAKYVNKAVKDAYEKGKKDAMKDSLGNFGKNKKQDGKGSADIDNLGAMLAKRNSNKKETVDYFKR